MKTSSQWLYHVSASHDIF